MVHFLLSLTYGSLIGQALPRVPLTKRLCDDKLGLNAVHCLTDDSQHLFVTSIALFPGSNDSV